MSGEWINTECQDCAKPMTVEIVVNSLFSIEALASMATCDVCHAKRVAALAAAGKKKAPPVLEARLAARVPYAD